MNDPRVTTVWEYLSGPYQGLRFTSGDVDVWPNCKLIAREVDMPEPRRLAFCNETNTPSRIIQAQVSEALRFFRGEEETK